MTRLKETTRATLMTLHGATMLGLGFGLLYIRATMTNFLFYLLGCVLALLLVAASLLLIAVLDWICAAGLGIHRVSKLRGLLFLSTGAAACGIFLFIYSGATIEMLGYVIAVYALLLGAGKAYLARYWIGTRREQVVMWALTGIAFTFSGILFWIANRDERDVLAAIAYYCLFVGLQMFLSMFFLQHNMEAIGTAARSK